MAGIFTKAPLSSVITDADGRVIDSTSPLPVDPAESGAVHLTTSQVSVTSSATQLLVANSTRRAALITNNDATTAIFVGIATVTAITGHKVAAGASISIPFTGAIYAITASLTVSASVSEVYD